MEKAEIAKYEELGYKVIGRYKGSTIEKSHNLYYMSNSINPRMAFNQGGLQTVINSTGGVDAVTGYSTSPTAGRIINSNALAQYANKLKYDKGTRENLLPVYDAHGNLIALERSVDPAMYKGIKTETDFAKNIGIWAGRQIEEDKAEQLNEMLLKNLKNQYEHDKHKENWINLYDIARKDRVVADALRMMSTRTRAMIGEVFQDKFMVRPDMIDDLIGRRRATVVDFATGNNRFTPQTNRQVADLIRTVFGKKGFSYLYHGERLVMTVASSTRNWIVIRSGVVMASNLASNLFQLVVRGVPMTTIATSIPRILKEVETFNRYRVRIAKLQADLQAAYGEGLRGKPQALKIQNEIDTINDAIKYLSIYPLLEAGEYNTIADIGDTEDDISLSTSKWGEWLEKQVDRLPDGVKTLGQYAIISKNTSLYRALEKGVRYGDFIAKVITYEHLTNTKNMSHSDALRTVRYEYVNYDMLAGRSREYLENIGLLWFYNFKLRTTRVALSMFRENPLRSVLYLTMPHIAGLGSPLTDNIVAKILGGGITGSMGLGMMFDILNDNLWVQMLK